MSQPVKLSDALVLDARIAGEAQERSIAGQVEFWAKLGQAVEPLLTSRQLVDLRQSGRVRPLSQLVASVETPEGRARTKAYLDSRPYPHYRQFPGMQRVYVRRDKDGTETVGRFVDRVFVAVDVEGQSRAQSTKVSVQASGKNKSGSAASPDPISRKRIPSLPTSEPAKRRA
jgi:ParD-like antitoxin of type II bacterial toxin-antitoxin system